MRDAEPRAQRRGYGRCDGFVLQCRALGELARVLDRDENALTFLAMDAKRLGLLDIKSGGGMTVVSFDAILTDKERRLIHGAH